VFAKKKLDYISDRLGYTTQKSLRHIVQGTRVSKLSEKIGTVFLKPLKTTIICGQAMAWPRWLVARLSLKISKLVHVWEVVDKVELRQFFLEFFSFPNNIIPLWLSTFIYRMRG
jgi:hypothetical protein